MKTPKVQKGNPHELTRRQHVFPARSLRRFCGSDGKVELVLRKSGKQLRVRPNSELFCAIRAWDQRAEAGFMREIEDAFQKTADDIVNGARSLSVEESAVVTKFFALWYWRFRFRHDPAPDQSITGIVHERLTMDQQEMLESNHIGVFGPDNKLASRFVSGIQIQMRIDQTSAQLKEECWSVFAAAEGEFIVPDDFGGLTVVPVSPCLCLIQKPAGALLSRDHVMQINRKAVGASKDYYVARDLSLCPL